MDYQAKKYSLYRRNPRGKLDEIFGDTMLQGDIFRRIMAHSDHELTSCGNALDSEMGR